MTLPEWTECIRQGRFNASADLLTLSISLPPGEVREFVTALSGAWFAKKPEDEFPDKQTLIDDLEGDLDHAQKVVDANPEVVATAFDDSDYASSVATLLSAQQKESLRLALGDLGVHEVAEALRNDSEFSEQVFSAMGAEQRIESIKSLVCYL